MTSRTDRSPSPGRFFIALALALACACGVGADGSASLPPPAAVQRAFVPPGATLDFAVALEPEPAATAASLVRAGAPDADTPADAARLQRWNPSAPGFDSAWLVRNRWVDVDGLPSSLADIPLAPGSAFRITQPATAPSPLLLAVAGAVPEAAPGTPASAFPGANLLGWPHPFPVAVADLPLSLDGLPPGAVPAVSVWDPTTSSYRTLGDDPDADPDWTLAPGEAFWVMNPSTNTFPFAAPPPIAFATNSALAAPPVALSGPGTALVGPAATGNGQPETGNGAFGAIDLLVRDNPAAAEVAAPGWRLLARLPAPAVCADPWPSTAPAVSGPPEVRLYLAAPLLDTDADGLPDAFESLVAGTDTLLADTDGDGIGDFDELLAGTDPLAATPSVSFTEGFEAPDIAPGTLHGQRGWSATDPARALVSTNAPLADAASFEIAPPPSGNSAEPVFAVHALPAIPDGAPDVLWFDAILEALPGDLAAMPPPSPLAVAFDPRNRPAVPEPDGAGGFRWRRLSDAALPPDAETVRVTLRFDFGAGVWRVLLDGLPVGPAIPIPPGTPRPALLKVGGIAARADNLLYSTVRPAGLSLDGDTLPDDWELAHLGSLDYGDTDDADADGLANAAEYRAGSDPLRPDTDGDGLPDGWEAAHGLDPLDPADAALDPDGDGRDNAAEYADGSDPGTPDLPAALRAPGLRAFLYALPDTPSAIPDTASLAADTFAVLPAIDFPATAAPWPELENAVVAATGLPDSSTFQLFDFWTLSACGFLDIPASGTYTLRLTSDDGSRLWLDGELLIDNDGAHSMTARTAAVPLSRGLHPLRIDYFEASGDAGLVLEWRPPDATGFVPVPAANLCHDASENLPPQLRLAPPARPYVAGESVPLLAGAWDFDGAVARVDFLVGTNAPVSVLPDASGLFTLDLLLGETVYSQPETGNGKRETPLVAIAYDEAGAASAPAAAALEVWTLPAGFALGLAAEYHPLAANPGALPDFAALTNGVPAIESQLAYASSTNPWPAFLASASGGVGGSPAEPGLFNSSTLQPADFGCFAAEIRGALLVTEPGRHKLRLSSDDGSRLWLDGELVIDNDGDHSMRGLSASRVLAPGLHPIRIEYYNGRLDAGLVLSWTPPSATGSAPIPPQHLYHPVGPLDADGDGIPDWWEAAHGLDPSDPGDALLDPDADGLTNLAEFLAGTAPYLADTDADGIPDAWEAAHGLCPFVADDAFLDPDLDGLSNLDEFRAGSDPHLADTDGDGIPDGPEVHELFTDPLLVDIPASRRMVAHRSADDSTARAGHWRRPDYTGALVCHRRGSLDFSVDIPTPGIHELVCHAAHEWFNPTARPVSAPESSRMLFFVDGVYVAARDIHAPMGETGVVSAPTPFLAPGTHEVRILWDNVNRRLRLRFDSLDVLAFGDTSAVSETWSRTVASARNGIDAHPGVFHVSPACIEGSARFPRLASAESDGTPLDVHLGAGERWYLDLPLAADAPAPLSLRFEDGGATASVSVVWEPLDLFSSSTNRLVLRSGDTLLVSAVPAGSGAGVAMLSLDGGQPFAADVPVPVLFDEPGLHSLCAVWTPADPAAQPLSAAVAVRCLAGSFPEGIAPCLAEVPRTWQCPDLPEDCPVETDGDTGFTSSADGTATLLVADTRGDRVLVARTAPGGPVLASKRLDPFWAVAAPDGDLWIGDESDGLIPWSGILVQRGLPAGVDVELRPYRAGLLFDDLSILRVISAADFSDAGEYGYDLLRSAGDTGSACHTVRFLHNGVSIGEAAYGPAHLPRELRIGEDRP